MLTINNKMRKKVRIIGNLVVLTAKTTAIMTISHFKLRMSPTKAIIIQLIPILATLKGMKTLTLMSLCEANQCSISAVSIKKVRVREMRSLTTCSTNSRLKTG